jgi:hypothetical protein
VDDARGTIDLKMDTTYDGPLPAAVIVASPDLVRVSCRIPYRMTLVNALCRAWEERKA